MTNSYPLIEARGTHRQLGQKHGEQCRTQIEAFLDYLGKTLKLSRQQIRDWALRFQPLFERHCPHLLEGFQDLSQGSVPLAEVLARIMLQSDTNRRNRSVARSRLIFRPTISESASHSPKSTTWTPLGTVSIGS